MTALRVVHNEQVIVKDYINRDILGEPRTGVLFSDFVIKTVERKSKRNGESYPRNYKTLLLHIDNFSKENNASIYTNSISEEFIDDFIIYLESQGLRQGYIKGLFSLLKAMVKKAAMYGYAVDPSYDDVTIKDEESFSVFLSMNEITRVYYFKGLTEKQERIRDLFVVGCLTALRYSDYSTLTRENFNDGFINKTTKKTGKKVIIPIHDYVREIYQKYDGEISHGLSIQHFNRYLKLIFKQIGFTDEISYNYTRGGKLITETRQKWELISSHTARRSAATNMYLTGRMKTYEIMSVTGHSTEKSFFKYIRVTHEDTAKQLASDNFFRI